MTKRSLNDFGAFDSKPAEKKWRFWMKTGPSIKWEGEASDWFTARHEAAKQLRCEPTQLIGGLIS